MDLLLTGASGFLGSQLATQWLVRHPAARIACLVRGDAAAATARLHAVLAQAVLDQGMPAAMGPLLERVTVLHGDLDEPRWVGDAGRWMRGPAELIHCAANLSFREADRPAVWHANVGGTASLVEAMAALPGVAAFNYVSTAYVAGDRQGEILEHDTTRPARFNNPYEESKWTAERDVRAGCQRLGRPYRVFRPSIIIAHSVTHRLSSASGFYKVAEVLLQLGSVQRGAIRLPVPPGTTLDLIPVDIVVTELLDLIDLGARSHGETYHLTSAAPLSLAAVLSQLTPMSGVSIGPESMTPESMSPESVSPESMSSETGPEAGSSRITALVLRSLRHYLPYFSYVRQFARHNAAARGAPRRQAGLALDVDGLRASLAPYLAARRPSAGAAVEGA